ncbi:MAG: hypothetical protein WC905_04280 [Patescibacteria group bacterium]|jgi:hypothetical protein
MNGKWLCDGCHSQNENGKTRCGFCGVPQPLFPTTPAETEEAKEAKLTQMLHNTIEKLTGLQKKKTFRYFEDNFL